MCACGRNTPVDAQTTLQAEQERQARMQELSLEERIINAERMVSSLTAATANAGS